MGWSSEDRSRHRVQERPEELLRIYTESLLSASDLCEPYAQLYSAGKIEEYISRFCKDGLVWALNMEIQRLAVHLVPVIDVFKGPSAVPTRLALLRELISIPMSPENLEACYERLVAEGDLEAAATAAGDAVASIWERGISFDRYNAWHERIEWLLGHKEGLSPLARASLLGYKGQIEMMGWGNLALASKTLDCQLLWAEKAGSPSLQVFHAFINGYCCLWAGDASKLSIIMDEVSSLVDLPETSLHCKAFFQIIRGAFYLATGEVEGSIALYRMVLSHPLFDVLPHSIWLFAYCGFLLALSFAGDTAAVEKVAAKVRDRAVPDHIHFHKFYVDYCLGIAALGAGEPYQALLHSQRAAERGHLSGSPVPERVTALLTGQSLSDLGRDAEAFDHFRLWLGRWREAGFHLYAEAAVLELAHLCLKAGRHDEARDYLEHSLRTMKGNITMPAMYRSASFIEALRERLLPAAETVSLSPRLPSIAIETFGPLTVTIGDRTLYDRKWQGGMTKKLLKALLACGGVAVSSTFLADALWPDAEGDVAANNLKVTLSRLRKVAVDKGGAYPPWIAMRHGTVSIDRECCFVDSLAFKDRIDDAMKQKNDYGLFEQALGLYKDNFLPQDAGETWIVRRRELLKKDFISGVLEFTGLCMERNRDADALEALSRAIGIDPLQERVYAQLMRYYIKLGYSSDALRVYRQAVEALKRELGVEPGGALTTIAREAGFWG